MKLKQSDILHLNRCAGRKQSRNMMIESCIKHTIVRDKTRYTRKEKHKINY